MSTNNLNLRQLLVEHFSVAELKDLCFDLGIDVELFDSTDKLGLARGLVGHSQKNNQLVTLKAEISRRRPHISLDDYPATSQEYIISSDNSAGVSSDNRKNSPNTQISSNIKQTCLGLSILLVSIVVVGIICVSFLSGQVPAIVIGINPESSPSPTERVTEEMLENDSLSTTPSLSENTATTVDETANEDLAEPASDASVVSGSEVTISDNVQTEQWPVIFEINREIETGPSHLFTLERAELFQDQRLRLYVTYWNQTDQDQSFRIRLQDDISVYDGSGNVFPLEATNYSLGGFGAEHIDRGLKESYWFDFIITNPEAYSISANFNSGFVDWDAGKIDIILNLESIEFPEEVQPQIPESWPIIYFPDLEFHGKTRRDTFVRINKIEVFQEGRIRWNLIFENRTDTDRKLLINDIDIVDKSGNRYEIVAVSREYPQYGNTVSLTPNEIEEYWFETNIASTESRVLSILISSGYDEWDFGPFDVRLDLYQIDFGSTTN